MESDQFEQGLARVRRRFAVALPAKIDDSMAALERMSNDGAGSVETIVVAHRKLHEMCGIAPSVGFPATGAAARAAEKVLRGPAQTKRPLTNEEIEVLRAELDCLRATAQSELQAAPETPQR